LAVSLNDTKNFFNRLIYFAKDEKLQKRLSESGKKFVQTSYGKERLIDDVKNYTET
jgi:glycosyltransferase involved in cell wall biosynthesis